MRLVGSLIFVFVLSLRPRNPVAALARRRILSSMSSATLTVTAMVRAKPGNESKVREELLSLIDPSRADRGCLNYDLHQSAEDPAVFMFHENWTSKAELDAHLAKPDLQSTLGRVVPLLAEAPQILLWHAISTRK